MAENTGSGGHVRLGSRKMPLPRSRLLRIIIGSLLVVFGMFGFLPVLGFWMIPVGLLILSVDLPRVRRRRRQLSVWFSRKYPATAARLGVTGENNHFNSGRRPNGQRPERPA